jgi:hypothetical protein
LSPAKWRPGLSDFRSEPFDNTRNVRSGKIRAVVKNISIVKSVVLEKIVFIIDWKFEMMTVSVVFSWETNIDGKVVFVVASDNFVGALSRILIVCIYGTVLGRLS